MCLSPQNTSRTLLLRFSYCGRRRNTLDRVLVLAQEINRGSLNSCQAPKWTFNEVHRVLKIKSGSFNGCSADPHMVSIVCASDRCSMSPSFGHRLKKCWCAVYSTIYAMVVSNLHYQVAAAFGLKRALANLSTTLSIIPKLPFLPSRCRNYAIFISSSE